MDYKMVSQVRRAAKAGRRQEVRLALLQIAELDEHNEMAWLWLSGVVEPLKEGSQRPR